ncbi:shikimate dehydrogenase [Candidatus Kaiserbacteria bacterium]|nr:shikimate dehydrogenase [Candidatus Kaiserbacteria bacterium]
MTLQTAVVGHPISHSLSPLLHNAIYKHEGVDADMHAYDEEDIAAFTEKMRALPIHLAAVTLPHKQSVMQYVDEIDARASDIGAVNTLLNTDGVLRGYNTDIVGIEAALKGVQVSGKDVLLLGAGGAAYPVAYYLKFKGAHVFYHNRTKEKAEEMRSRFGGVVEDDLSSISPGRFSLIVNATSVGLKLSDPLPIREELITKDTTVLDLIYTETPLLKHTSAKGARAISGLSMFVAQGLEQERLWLDREIRDYGYTALLQDALQKQSI